MAIDLKYGRVTLEKGSIGEDELVFIFRARDALMVQTLQEYRRMCEESGSPQQHLDEVDSSIAAIDQWQQGNYSQVPHFNDRTAD